MKIVPHSTLLDTHRASHALWKDINNVNDTDETDHIIRTSNKWLELYRIIT